MSDSEKRMINDRLAEISNTFGLKVKLTLNNAQKVIEDNYKKMKKIDQRIKTRLSSLNKLAA
jgi:archaellum component FlaC